MYIQYILCMHTTYIIYVNMNAKNEGKNYNLPNENIPKELRTFNAINLQQDLLLSPLHVTALYKINARHRS